MSAHRELKAAQQALNEAVGRLFRHATPIRDLAVEMGDIIDTPDFMRNPDANEHTIGMCEAALERHLRPVLDAWKAYDAECARLDEAGGSSPRFTSINAAHANLPKKGSLRWNILLCVVAQQAQFGTGMTVAELKARLKKEHSSVSSAINALYERDWLRDSGDRRLTQHGEPAIVWAPTDKAIAKCRETALEVDRGS